MEEILLDITRIGAEELLAIVFEFFRVRRKRFSRTEGGKDTADPHINRNCLQTFIAEEKDAVGHFPAYARKGAECHASFLGPKALKGFKIKFFLMDQSCGAE